MFKKKKIEEGDAELFASELSVRFDKEKIYFDLDGDLGFFMRRESFLALFDFEKVARAFEGQEEKPKLDLPFEVVCKCIRLMRKGLDFIDTAKFFGFDEQLFREAWERQRQKHDSIRIEDEIKRQLEESGEKDTVMAYRQDPSTNKLIKTEIFIGLRKLKFYQRNANVEKFIKDLSLDEGDFKLFLEKNSQYLDLIK
jgi:hypothetical protein